RHVLLCERDMCLVIWHRIIGFWHVEYELQRTNCQCRQQDKGDSMYLLIFIVQQVVVFFMTHLTEHFSEYLSGMTICRVFIVLLDMLFSLRLDLLEKIWEGFYLD